MKDTVTSPNDLGDEPAYSCNDQVPLTVVDEEAPVDCRGGGPCQTPMCCRKNIGLNICVMTALWQFLTGVERSSVLPTLWLYLEIFWGKDAAYTYYGLILAAFGLSVLVANPFFGYASSKGVRVKVLLVFSNILEIIGNLMYFQASSPMICFAGRFIAGLGGGCESPLYADVTRCTDEKKRTPYIIAVALGKIFGLFVGPVLTLIVHYVSFEVRYGSFVFSVYNAPGILMAILWILHTICLVFYPIIDLNGRLVDMKASRILYNQSWLGCLLRDRSFVESRTIDDNSDNMNRNTTCLRRIQLWFRSFFGKAYIYKSYPVASLIFIIFAGSFNSMCLEAFLPELATQHYGWTEVEISYTYIGVVVILVVSCGFFYWLSKQVDDRVSLLISYSILTISYFVLIIAMGLLMNAGIDKTAVITLSLVAVGIHAWSMPGVVPLPESMFSKLIPLSEIDRAQTVVRFVCNLGFMVGMYFGGQLAYMPILVSVIMLVLAFIPCILFLMKFDQFRVTSFRTSENFIDRSEIECEAT